MEKKVKANVQLPHVNKISLSRKRIFVPTLFIHSILERKNSRRQIACFCEPLPVSTSTIHSNLTSKTKKMYKTAELTY